MSNDDMSPEELAAFLDVELDNYDSLDLDKRATGAAAAGGYTVNWRELADADARAVWTALRDWVQWFTVRYGVGKSVVPNCWFRHGALVEELSALHSAHVALFDPSDSGLGPIGWHERLTLARQRLLEATKLTGCTDDAHREPRARRWDNVTADDEWDQWSSQAHAN